MSAIGTFQIVPAELLSKLAVESSNADVFALILQEQTATFDYKYSGWVLATLLPVLADDYGIDLMNGMPDLANTLSERSGTTFFVLTPEQSSLAAKLDPALFEPLKLQSAYEAFNGTDADGVGEIMTAGIDFIRSGLEAIAPSSAGLLSIG